MDIAKDLANYPLSTVLVIVGALFALIAILPVVPTKWGPINAGSRSRRITVGVIGAIFFSSGILIYQFMPKQSDSGDHRTTVSNLNENLNRSDDSCGATGPPTRASDGVEEILSGVTLSTGYGMDVLSSDGRRDWQKTNEAQTCYMIEYPDNQSWGVAFVTVGNPNQKDRAYKDFSGFQTLLVEMKSVTKPETVDIGLKSVGEKDGTETKVPVEIIPEWKSYAIPLKQFTGTDLTRLWTVTEFVFTGNLGRRLDVRRIEFTRQSN